MSLLSNLDTIKKLSGKYWGRSHNNNSVDNIGFGFIHYSMIRNIKPDRVLCIGSQRGYIPIICAIACMDNKKGVVDFVDAGYSHPDPRSWGGVGLWQNLPSDYFDEISPNLKNFIKVHPFTTEQFFKKVKDSNPDTKYQYAYIDGDHSLEGVTKDYKLVYNLLEKGGYMSFHDVEVDKDTVYGKCGVRDFWYKEPFTYSKAFEKITFPFEAGLGLLRRVE